MFKILFISQRMSSINNKTCFECVPFGLSTKGKHSNISADRESLNQYYMYCFYLISIEFKSNLADFECVFISFMAVYVVLWIRLWSRVTPRYLILLNFSIALLLKWCMLFFISLFALFQVFGRGFDLFSISCILLFLSHFQIRYSTPASSVVLSLTIKSRSSANATMFLLYWNTVM